MLSERSTYSRVSRIIENVAARTLQTGKSPPPRDVRARISLDPYRLKLR